MIEKLKGIEERFVKVEHLLSDPAIIRDQKKYQEYLIEHGELNKIVPAFREYEGFLEELKEAKELLRDNDPEIRAMAKEEVPALEQKIEEYKSRINILLMPKDPRDDKNVILEIRAGTGGEEAGLFAGDLFRMYSRYVESRHWEMELVEKTVSSSGGFKEIVSLVKGKGVFSNFKYESGTHRVQRVPETEAQGRIHTSAVTVAVHVCILPWASVSGYTRQPLPWRFFLKQKILILILILRISKWMYSGLQDLAVSPSTPRIQQSV